MKILVIRVKGIGNMVMFTPTLISLRKNFPDAVITLLSDKPSGEVIRGSNLVNEIVYFNINDPFFEKLKVIYNLRKRHFEYSIMTFPGHKLAFNLFAFLLGAKKRVTHKYDSDNIRTLAFLQNVKVPAIEGIHDVEQNIRLLEPFGINCDKKNPFFSILPEDKLFAESYFKENKLKKVIAIHAGGLDEQAFKRWPIKNFSSVTKLFQKGGFDVLLIAGPGEEIIAEQINDPLKRKARIVSGVTIKQIASVVSKCHALLCSDSGIGHIAAALKVPTLSLVGPGDYKRIGPYGGGTITHKTPCSPCIHYPFRTSNSDYSKIVCKTLDCLSKISPEEVRNRLFSLIAVSP